MKKMPVPAKAKQHYKLFLKNKGKSFTKHKKHLKIAYSTNYSKIEIITQQPNKLKI